MLNFISYLIQNKHENSEKPHDWNFVKHMLLQYAIMGVLFTGLNISAKKELQSLCCMMGKTMSFRYRFLADNDWRLIDWIQKKIKMST